MADIAGLKLIEQQRWQAAKVLRGPDFDLAAARLVASNAKAHYLAVATTTGVPWWFIAVVHERECSQS